MIVVADTGPLNYLIRLGFIDLLPRLYGSVLIPKGVIGELLDPRAPDDVRAWATQLPSWAESRTVPLEGVVLPNGLGIGEREAITLAELLSAELVLMDEVRGRRVAVSRGLTVGGTLSVLAMGNRFGIVDFEEATDRLQDLGFRVSRQLIHDILNELKS